MRTALYCGILLAASAGLAGAQEEEVEVEEQVIPTEGVVITATPYAGRMVWRRLFEAEEPARFIADDDWLFGVQLGVGLTPYASLLGNVAYSDTEARVEFPDRDGRAPIGGDLDMLLADLNLELRFRIRPELRPFGQFGIGIGRYALDTGGGEARGTDAVFNAGGGLDYVPHPNLAFRFMVKDYVTAFDWDEPPGLPLADVLARNVTSNIAVTVGVTIGAQR